MQNPPIDHHYIPKFYTKQWCGSGDPRVERFTVEAGRLIDRRVYPEQVGKKKHLYSIPGMPDGQGQILESNFFKKVDDVAAQVIARFTADPVSKISPIDRKNWCIFLYSLFHRTPHSLAAVKIAGEKAWRESIPEVVEQLRQDDGERNLDELERQLVDGGVTEAERLTLLGLPRLTANPNVIGFLLRMHWRVYTFPNSEREFLLSDNPVVQSDGIDQEEGHIAMPLTPRKLLVMTRDAAFQNTIAHIRPADLVRSVNTWIVESARHFVVARDLSQKRFIENRFGKWPKPALTQIQKASPPII